MKITVVKKVQKHDTRSCPFVIEGLPEPPRK
jgi:hypothetical protein